MASHASPVAGGGRLLLSGRRPAPACYKSPDDQDDNGAHDSTDEAGSFAGLIPAHRLAEISSDDRSDIPKIAVRTNPAGSFLEPG